MKFPEDLQVVARNSISYRVMYPTKVLSAQLYVIVGTKKKQAPQQVKHDTVLAGEVVKDLDNRPVVTVHLHFLVLPAGSPHHTS